MATSAPTANSFRQEKVNYIRLSNLLIDIGRKVLKDIFDSIHKPASLHGVLWSSPVHNTLKNLKSKRVLYTQQWQTLYPSSGSATSVNFDITLLFLLLRNVCGLKAPGSGWDDAPLPADISLEADLVRIKRCRNNLAHNPAQALPDSEMEKHWVVMETVLTRLGGLRYWPEIQRLKFEAVDPANENIVLLHAWEEGERSTLDAIHRLEKRFDQMSLNTPPASITITGVVKQVTAAGTVLVWAGGSAYILHRYQDDPDTMIRLLHSAIFPGAFFTGGLIRELLRGSFKILIEIQSLEALEHLWKSYKTGELKSNLEDVFINQDIINSAPEDITKVELSIVINEDEYHEASRRLMDEKWLPEQSLPSYHPENTSISSKRASNTVVTLIDKTGKSSPIVYEAEQLGWTVIIWLLTKGSAVLPVTTGKLEISIDDPLKAISVALIGTNGDINVRDVSGKTPLMNAEIEGKEEVIQALSEFGADPSMFDPKRKSAVEYVTDFESVKISKNNADNIAELLLAAGVDVNLGKGETALAWSIRRSYDDIVNVLIKAGADVNAEYEDQRTPLMIAVENIHKSFRYTDENDEKIVNALIKAGADVNAKDKHQSSPLMIAVTNNNEQIAERLIDAGADVNHADSNGQTALICAISNSNYQIAYDLIGAGADVNAQYEDQRTPLMIVVENMHDRSGSLYENDKKIVNVLIRAGADVNAKDKDQKSPLIIAVNNNKHYITERLLDAGGDVNLVDSNGETALTLAIKKGDEKFVNAMIRADAVVNAKDKCQRIPLIIAVENNKETIAETLLDAGADPIATDSKAVLGAALVWAAKKGRDQMVNEVIKAGQDVNIKDKSQMSPLMHAVQNIKEETAQILINAGADVNVLDDQGRTPLIWATILGIEKTVVSLIKAGADVNAQNRYQRTPLIIAILNSSDTIAELLIDSGADVDVADDKGQTPLIWAVKKGNKKIVQTLVKAGANVNHKDNSHKTPLMHAQQTKNELIAEQLIAAGAM